MTQPRSQLVSPGSDGAYHCIQRCVRRAFLCGFDSYTGQSFEHRKHWVETRLRLLADCFAVAIHAYAVMSNHLHVIVQLVPDATGAWSDEEVAIRWGRIFPPRQDSAEAFDAKRKRLMSDPERLAIIRRRLCDLSWFMRCLAEPIARRANREDRCKGRFWEGRFKAQLLCDEHALLAAMAYVDLNPIRAGIAQRLNEAAHTSAAARLTQTRKVPEALAAPLCPVLGLPRPALVISTADYLQLLEWTGGKLAPGKRGRITGDPPACVRIVDTDAVRWTTRVRGVGSGYWRAVGSAEQLIELARRIGQRWLKGLRLAERLG